MNFDEISNEEELIHYWELVFTIWKEQPKLYSKLLSYLSELFYTDFDEYAPIQLVGDYTDTSNKVLVVSLHPSANMNTDYIKFEHKQRKFSAIPTERKNIEWRNQVRFAKEYFRILRDHNISLLLLTNIEKLIRYYEQSTDSYVPKYELLQKRVINVEMLPFYSKKVSLASINPVLKGSFKRIKKFYNENEFDVFLINGKMLYDELLKLGFVQESDGESTPIVVRGIESEIKNFEIEYNGSKKKGIAIPHINSLSDGQKREVAREMRKISEWNRKNAWEVIQE